MNQPSTPREHTELLQIAFQFHTSARSEIAHRVGLRDAVLFLFLAGSASLFGVSLNGAYRPVLYAIPILGLGASQVFSQHNIVIGALTRYLGIEIAGWLRQTYREQDLPVQWNNSQSYLEMRNGGFARPLLLSGLTLIVMPQALALTVVGIGGLDGTLDFIGMTVGVASAGLSFATILLAHRTRANWAKELRQFASEPEAMHDTIS